jgi:hypothetical protein
MAADASPDLSWTAEEDAYCVWSFMMNPICGQTEHSRIPAGRAPRDLLPRFHAILASRALQERVLGHCDVVRLHRVLFSPLEDLAIAKAQRCLRTNNGEQILEAFGPWFHASRSPSSVVSRICLHQMRGAGSWSAQLQAFQRFRDAVAQRTAGAPLADVAARAEDIEPHLLDERLEPVRRAPVFESVGQMRAHVQARFAQSDLFALRGPGRAVFCAHAVTTVGRRTAAAEADVDIGPFAGKGASRVHATISFAWDMQFYLEVGGRLVIVNGAVFTAGKTVRLRDLDVLDIGGYVCVFVENAKLMGELRAALDPADGEALAEDEKDESE